MLRLLKRTSFRKESFKQINGVLKILPETLLSNLMSELQGVGSNNNGNNCKNKTHYLATTTTSHATQPQSQLEPRPLSITTTVTAQTTRFLP